MKPIIQVDSVKKQYRNSDFYSLKGIDLSVPEQSIFGLLGPNGAGKTTLISILSGLVKPTTGNYFIGGLDASKSKKEIRNLIGIVPQEYALYPTLTAYENLMYFGSLFNISKSKLKSLVTSYLSELGLEEFTHKKVQTFSGGMKRRVNLIAGILHHPKILFLDEPTVGVDVQSRSKIVEFLKELNQKGTTIIYTSHLMAEAEEFCSHIAIIDQGKIITEGTTQNLLQSIPNVYHLEEIFIRLTGKQLRDDV